MRFVWAFLWGAACGRGAGDDTPPELSIRSTLGGAPLADRLRGGEILYLTLDAHDAGGLAKVEMFANGEPWETLHDAGPFGRPCAESFGCDFEVVFGGPGSEVGEFELTFTARDFGRNETSASWAVTIEEALVVTGFVSPAHDDVDDIISLDLGVEAEVHVRDVGGEWIGCAGPVAVSRLGEVVQFATLPIEQGALSYDGRTLVAEVYDNDDADGCPAAPSDSDDRLLATDPFTLADLGGEPMVMADGGWVSFELQP